MDVSSHGSFALISRCFLKDPIKSLALRQLRFACWPAVHGFEPETVPCPEIKVIKGYENVSGDRGNAGSGCDHAS